MRLPVGTPAGYSDDFEITYEYKCLMIFRAVSFKTFQHVGGRGVRRFNLPRPRWIVKHSFTPYQPQAT